MNGIWTALLLTAAAFGQQTFHVAGTVTDSHTGQPIRGALVQVSPLRGKFQFETMAPGAYRPLAGYATRMLVLRSVALDGAPVRQEMFDLEHTAEIELTANLSGASVHREVSRDDKPVAGAMAILAPAQESSNPINSHAFQTDSDGSFEWDALPPGDYVVIVKEDWFDLEYANPDVMRPLLGSGHPVQFEGTGTQKLRIELK